MIPFPDHRYSLIMADPPWSYNNDPSCGSITEQYPTLSIKDICNLPIEDIAEDNCSLFLWITTPLLPDGLKCLEAWGFTYKTSILWTKIHYGLGFWFRTCTELCLVGIKGDVPPFHSQFRNHILSRPSIHSKKPDEIYTIIDSLPYKNRIELFARYAHPGWDTWGLEAPNPNIPTPLDDWI